MRESRSATRSRTGRCEFLYAGPPAAAAPAGAATKAARTIARTLRTRELMLSSSAVDPQIGDRPPLWRGRGLDDAEEACSGRRKIDGGQLALAGAGGNRVVPVRAVPARVKRVAAREVPHVDARVEHDPADPLRPAEVHLDPLAGLLGGAARPACGGVVVDRVAGF